MIERAQSTTRVQAGDWKEPGVDQVRSGSRAVFNALYDRYAARVTGYLFQLTGSRAEAEDLTQETFLAGYVGREGYRGSSQPLAWLLGIAVRRWRDRRRKPQIPTEPLTDSTPVTFISPSRPEAQALARVTLERALARLEPSFREALLLVASQGMTYREAAEILEEPVGTVKWRVHEATQRMRGFLDEERSGEHEA